MRESVAAESSPRLKELVERRLIQRRSILLHGATRQQTLGIQATFGKTLPELRHQRIATRVLKIILVDKDERRNVIASKQAPQSFGMPLRAVVGAHHQNRVVERTQRTLSLGRKIDVAGSVHKHNVGVAVIEYSLRRENRDATLALNLVRVQVRVAVIHTPALANATCVEQHGLGQRGLAGIDMCQDSNDRLLRHDFPR